MRSGGGDVSSAVCFDWMMKRLLRALLMLSTGPSTLHAAEPRPVQLSMKAIEGETRHLAAGTGAINRHGSLTITVELLPGKSVKAVALGTHKEHNLYAKQGYSSDEETTWKTTWTGSWEEPAAGQALTLELTLAAQECKRTKAWEGQPPTTEPCREVSKKSKLVCTSERVFVEESGSAPSRKKPAQVAAWVCNAPSTLELGETPSRWVLGKTSCLQSAGRQSWNAPFRRCDP